MQEKHHQRRKYLALCEPGKGTKAEAGAWSRREERNTNDAPGGIEGGRGGRCGWRWFACCGKRLILSNMRRQGPSQNGFL